MDMQIAVIGWDSKSTTVTARLIEGGLALHPALNGKRGYWQISHIASGKGIGKAIRGLPKATAILHKLVPLWDWTKGEDSIRALSYTESNVLQNRIRQAFIEAGA